MPPFLDLLAKGGTTAIIMAFFMWLTWKFIEGNNKKEDELRKANAKLMEELTEAVIQSTKDNAMFNALHNERSMVFQKQVSDAHQGMMQILCEQNKFIGKFDYAVDEMKKNLNKLCEKA